MEEKNKLEAVKKKYEKSFQSKRPSYEKLALNIKLNLEALLKENSIDFMEVNYRIKESDSFYEKICRKEKEKNRIINEPFEEIQDICGIRVICCYVTDLKEVDTIIGKNFEVIKSDYKNKNLKINEFGYFSNHYIVRLKEEWLKLPILKGLDDFIAEIQVRTILMHAWADISHKLSYKQANYDKSIARKLNQLSALFEIADSHFITLKSMSQDRYSKEIENNNIPVEYDIDLMRAIFKDYIKIKDIKRISDDEIIKLIDTLRAFEIPPAKLIEYFKNIEKEEIKIIIKEFFNNGLIEENKIDEEEYTAILLMLMDAKVCEIMEEEYDYSQCVEFMKIKNKIKNEIEE